ncbi:MAG: glycosyltransferase [Muribaculaceae bacterium]|nr:glycosyltransferase [Muribaculaceae bacterium]
MSVANIEEQKSIDLLVETSWEVCNKIGGIYTVLSTKARVLKEAFDDKLVFIGPDVWSDISPSPFFIEDKCLLKNFSSTAIDEFDITIKTGRWNIPGSPQVILVGFKGVYPYLNAIFAKMWELYGVDSMHEYGDYREGCAFSIAASIVIMKLAAHLSIDMKKVTAHFNEWTTGMGLLYLQWKQPLAATLFTTHATSIGRSICGNGKPLYDYFHGYNGDQMAGELNMQAKHSLEKKAAHNADCFTAVSEITAKESEQLLEIYPQVVTPNGFEPDFVPGGDKYKILRKNGRERLLKIAGKLKQRKFKSADTVIVATSGRNEYRNKGLDIFLDSLSALSGMGSPYDVIALILVPAWVNSPIEELMSSKKKIDETIPDYITHYLNNMDTDAVASRIRALESQHSFGTNISVIYVPCYLNGGDGIVNISYYDLLPALDLTVFPSYYEPWGYTPLESIAFGIPTITSDKSGFGQWILSEHENSLFKTGVKVVERTDSNYQEALQKIAGQILEFIDAAKKERQVASEAAMQTSEKADWKYFIENYYKAFRIASERRNERIRK